MLRLLDVLKPVYQRQPAFTQAMKRWRQQQVNYLQQTGQAQEAMKLLKQLVADYPHDSNLLQQYANDLAQIGEHETAYRLLLEALGGKIEWQPYEEESLRSTYCQLMQSQGRWAEMADFLAAVAQTQSRDVVALRAVPRRVGAVGQDRRGQRDWPRSGSPKGKCRTSSPPAAAARLQAAVGFMLGNCYGIYMEPARRALAAAAGRCGDLLRPARDARPHVPTASWATGDSRRPTSAGGCASGPSRCSPSATGIASYKPAEIQRLVNWAMPNDPAVEQQKWRTIAQRLRKRWDEEKKPGGPAATGPTARADSLRPIDAGGVDRLLASAVAGCIARVSRGRCPAIVRGPDRPAVVAGDTKTRRSGLLEKLSEGQKEPAARLAVQLGALHRLTDRMIEARYQAKMKAVEHPEKLTPHRVAGEAEREPQGGLRRFCRSTPAGDGQTRGADRGVAQRRAAVLRRVGRAESRQGRRGMLGSPGAGAEETRRTTTTLRRCSIKLFRSRFLTTLANLAARKTAPAGTAERLLKYVDAGIAAADKDDLQLADGQVSTARGARPAERVGAGVARVGGGRRARQPLATLARLSAGRARQAGRGDRAVRGGGRGRRAWPRRASHAGRLVHGRRPPREP